ncbi:D-alanyl-D-alanine carboxypeptidase/D-alanyl-D-alanine-endopeptidase [Paracoccus sp. TK19116]|uniref:D-alanyl-D-alanine carboxypeptidase/D-alanyl-D-alanine-endopeptidase n=1 Tax=Paracoccus albicereus TaxID=2922394 RepID=A0ABT1MU72_9RHOB|nr:D-alanyl-D-alanine carboxypeptidase/D-alanyl-D-alanine-endopeptidase [Paracoccus albicereus]MCQ0971837.1 D-alanyl-D-alanine carboxypeptidase/D-alanyl-D-alanine-endopeptidase [Paracoccus albicereus]
MFDRRTFLIGAFLAPAALRAEISSTALGARPPLRPAPDPTSLIAAAGLAGDVSFAAIDAATGDVMAMLGTQAFPPASTMKAITTLYALDRLGPDHRFRTRVVRAGDMLVLAGGGDPVLSTDDLALLADQLVKAGEPSPARFAVWGGALPTIQSIAPEQAIHVAYNPALSGMILNFNRVHLDWRQAGSDYQISLEARAASNSPRAYTVTARAADQAVLFTYHADEAQESWAVSRAAMGRSGSRWLPVRLPELYAGDVFQTLCRARGLVLPTPEVIDTLPAGSEVAAVESPPLQVILRDMMTYSTNLTAEVVGLHASGASTLAASGAAMRDWLAGKGIGDPMVLADHSGLSPDSRITSMTMARVMAGPGKAADLQRLMKAHPLDEDLGDADARSPAVRAKTGTLNFVSNLAGYATDADGRQIAFTIFCADLDRRAATEGQELPAGVSTWTRRAKILQRALIDAVAAA